MLLVLRDLFSASLSLLWVVGLFHTAVDAKRRFANRSACRFWTVLALVLPIAGPSLYLLVRPSETRDERRVRRRRQMCLELAARSLPRHAVAQVVPPAPTAAEPVPQRLAAHRPFEAQPAAR